MHDFAILRLSFRSTTSESVLTLFCNNVVSLNACCVDNGLLLRLLIAQSMMQDGFVDSLLVSLLSFRASRSKRRAEGLIISIYINMYIYI